MGVVARLQPVGVGVEGRARVDSDVAAAARDRVARRREPAVGLHVGDRGSAGRAEGSVDGRPDRKRHRRQ
ncbi:hypothetical protein [Halalkalicoccus salilacus]|uniref:hypothetical protein n=1 Tax=Halalkalicoccus sp. GCM10025704 TaxID=3252662 RepID=UPI003607DAAB